MKLIVVIVSWNTVELTRNCLKSLFPELSVLDNEVWIVDNHITRSLTKWRAICIYS
jgi:GT2 family glycosyltransferase